MRTCEKFEESYIDYVCDLLDDQHTVSIEAHLRNCPDCAREVEEFKQVLKLTDQAGTIPIPTSALEDIEVNVYKRLAAESDLSNRGRRQSFHTSKTPLRRRFPFRSRKLLPRSLPIPTSSQRSPWIWGGVFAVCTLVVGLLAVVFFFAEEEPLNVPLSSIEVQSSSERIDQYIQQEVQRDFEEAMITRHLRNDERTAASQFRRVAEQGRGTRFSTMATEQLQVVYITSK